MLSKIKVALVMSLSPDAYASHSSSSSLNFLMFYIESKQEITLIFYLLHIFKEVNKHVLIQVVYDCFQLGLSFLRWVFIGHSKFQIIEIAKLLIWETKFRDENGTFIDVCVCMCICLFVYSTFELQWIICSSYQKQTGQRNFSEFA